MRASIFRAFFSIVLLVDLAAVQVGGLTYHNSMKPGASDQIQIPLISDKDSAEAINFNLCDYASDAEGHHFFNEIGQNPRSCAKWVTLSTHRETISPGEKKELTLTVAVPNDPQLQGSYWTVVLIEPTNPLQTLVEPERGFQLQVKVRYAFHIVVDIGDGVPSLKILKKGIEEINGKKWFSASVENKGTLFLNPKMIVKLYDEKGALKESYESQPERLYPGSSAHFLADGKPLTAGKYTAFLILDNGDGKMFGDNFELSLP